MNEWLIQNNRNKKNFEFLVNRMQRRYSFFPFIYIVGVPLALTIAILSNSAEIAGISLLLLFIVIFFAIYWAGRDDKKARKLRYKCWHPDIYFECVYKLLNQLFIGSAVIMFYLLCLVYVLEPTKVILFLKPFVILVILFIFVFPLLVKVFKIKTYKQKEMKNFRKHYEDMEQMIGEILQHQNVAYKKKPVSRFSLDYVYKLYVLKEIKCYLSIKPYPKSTEISFRPVNKNNINRIRALQKEIDLKSRNLPDSSASLFRKRR